jgi:hypothetical protein
MLSPVKPIKKWSADAAKESDHILTGFSSKNTSFICYQTYFPEPILFSELEQETPAPVIFFFHIQDVVAYLKVLKITNQSLKTDNIVGQIGPYSFSALEIIFSFFFA